MAMKDFYFCLLMAHCINTSFFSKRVVSIPFFKFKTYNFTHERIPPNVLVDLISTYSTIILWRVNVASIFLAYVESLVSLIWHIQPLGLEHVHFALLACTPIQWVISLLINNTKFSHNKIFTVALVTVKTVKIT